MNSDWSGTPPVVLFIWAMDIESRGYWYTAEIVPEESVIRIVPYYAETGTPLDAYVFPL